MFCPTRVGSLLDHVKLILMNFYCFGEWNQLSIALLTHFLLFFFLLLDRRGDLPFTMRRIVTRTGVESDDDAEPKSETPEPKPE